MSNANLPESLAFTIGDNGLTWRGSDPRSAQELMDQYDRNESKNRIEMARIWLANRLASGEVRSSELQAEALEAGISERTLNRARADLEVVAEQRDGEWYARLPDRPGEDGDLAN